MICGDTKAKKKKQKDSRAARKLRKDEEMAWAPPRKMSNWPDWEEASEKYGRKRVEAGARRRRESVGNHYRVGCGGRHFREPGWRMP